MTTETILRSNTLLKNFYRRLDFHTFHAFFLTQTETHTKIIYLWKINYQTNIRHLTHEFMWSLSWSCLSIDFYVYRIFFSDFHSFLYLYTHTRQEKTKKTVRCASQTERQCKMSCVRIHIVNAIQIKVRYKYK